MRFQNLVSEIDSDQFGSFKHKVVQKMDDDLIVLLSQRLLLV